MSSFSLDDIRAAADSKYANTTITVGGTDCVLLNPLRLPKEKRADLESIQTKMEAEDADQEAILKDAVRAVARSTYEAECLLNAIGDDLAVLASTFDAYTKGTEAGEA